MVRFKLSQDTEWVPPMDVCETQDAFLIQLEVPGIPLDQLAITLENDVLVVEGVKQPVSDPGRTCIHRLERGYGAFRRALQLPRQVDPAGITASCRDGVLYIHLGKRQNPSPVRVPVQVNAKE
ncbi:MAG: Hsp20/alpha crystallin family protein [Chloroflexi bacterium]|nr:Hsp20/alpha crystallin family protein [Chloroflexota bacterium]